MDPTQVSRQRGRGSSANPPWYTSESKGGEGRLTHSSATALRVSLMSVMRALEATDVHNIQPVMRVPPTPPLRVQQ
eukprot:CAMPEP_0195110736 /NCGR_PEP_ID=MMETSP0448-20130528/93793_1 /TAXON_ID=66468 /ORGANISM="Heterocapsa triquestra, Strain CCMP 448" /LENGTH=75 /DNA_ID=CAMNT_0040147465 /DNA_START=102 /DNA_END=329 /DNA_ORIENTATION=-